MKNLLEFNTTQQHKIALTSKGLHLPCKEDTFNILNLPHYKCVRGLEVEREVREISEIHF